MVAIMVAITVIVVISVIVTIPMAFVIVPAILVAVIVWVAPIPSGVRRTVPASRNPHIAATADAPVAIDPDIARAWQRRAPLIAYRWRCAANHDANLPGSRRREGGSCNGCHSKNANK